jgi:O-antigen/teichoic acid export membrane protein
MFLDRKHPETRHTLTISLFAVGILFLPALLIASRPFGPIGAGLGTGCSVLCIVIAWMRLTRRSPLFSRL